MSSRTELEPVSRMSIDAIDAEVCVLLRPDAHPDVVSDIWLRVEWLLDAARRIKEVRNACLLNWLPENGGELVIGDTKIYAGKKSSEHVRDLKAAVMSAIELLDGNADVFASLLKSDALKPGESAKVLGPDWRAEHFEKRYEPTVEVKVVNQKFLKGKKASNG